MQCFKMCYCDDCEIMRATQMLNDNNMYVLFVLLTPSVNIETLIVTISMLGDLSLPTIDGND